jgi:tRNA wybutosine-synthesizing protein 2
MCAAILTQLPHTKKLKDALESTGLKKDKAKMFQIHVDQLQDEIALTTIKMWGTPLVNGILLCPNRTFDYHSFLERFDGPSVIVHTSSIDNLFEGTVCAKTDSLRVKAQRHLERVLNLNFDLVQLLMTSFPKGWERYSSFLLFSETAFTQPEWQDFLKIPDQRESFYEIWCHDLKVTHIARRSRIDKDDILRKPSIVPLYGPWTERMELVSPQEDDFNNAFWATAQQNSILCTWAPMYTMFSAGNISEKLRIANSGTFHSKDQIVVDLYAGIGYFALPYALKTGAKVVYACELNPWSVEGLRRGLLLNGFHKDCDPSPLEDGESFVHMTLKSRVYLYPGDNRLSVSAFEGKADRVNLGLLPSSESGWDVAVRALNRTKGGWLHIHVNLRKEEVQGFKDTILTRVGKLLSSWSFQEHIEPQVVHVERVKSFSPKVFHYVFDVLCCSKT